VSRRRRDLLFEPERNVVQLGGAVHLGHGETGGEPAEPSRRDDAPGIRFDPSTDSRRDALGHGDSRTERSIRLLPDRRRRDRGGERLRACDLARGSLHRRDGLRL
jgi:hypothetical protein